MKFVKVISLIKARGLPLSTYVPRGGRWGHASYTFPFCMGGWVQIACGIGCVLNGRPPNRRVFRENLWPYNFVVEWKDYTKFVGMINMSEAN